MRGIISVTAQKLSPFYQKFKEMVINNFGTMILSQQDMRENFNILDYPTYWTHIFAAKKGTKLIGAKPDNSPNILPFADDFSHASWQAGGGIKTPNAALAPDGTITACYFENTSGSTGSTNKTFVSTENVIIFTVYTKSGTATEKTFGVRNISSGTTITSAVVNYTSGTISGNGWSIFAIENGWYQLEFTSAAGSISTGDTLSIYYGRIGDSGTVAGESWFVWGASVRGYNNQPDIIFSRATDATYINSDGKLVLAGPDTPVFEYDHKGKCKGLTKFAGSTNWIRDSYSSNINTYGGSALAEIETDYTWNFTTIYEHAVHFPALNETRRCLKLYTDLTSVGTYCFSCYVKMDDGGAPVPYMFNNAPVSSSDFHISLYGSTATSLVGIRKLTADGVYLVWGSRAITALITDGSFTYSGLQKNSGGSGRGFRAIGFQVNQGSYPQRHTVTYGTVDTTAGDTLNIKQIVLPNLLTEGVSLYFSGIIEATNDGAAQEGNLLQVSNTSTATAVAGLALTVSPRRTSFWLSNAASGLSSGFWLSKMVNNMGKEVRLVGTYKPDGKSYLCINGEIITTNEFGNINNNLVIELDRIKIGTFGYGSYKALAVMPALTQQEAIALTKLT